MNFNSSVRVSGASNADQQITDPEDFQGTVIPQLSSLDTLLRCDICKEYYTSPVLSSCGHSFCSLCIRRYLVVESKCALCGQELRESGLRRNGVLEELVFAFGTVRGKLIEELSRRGQESNEGVEVEVIDLDEENNEGETYNDDIQIIKDVKKRKTGPVGLDSLLTKKPKVINATESQKRETMGECPVCSKKFPLDVLQSSHIDSCLSNPQPQPSTTTAAACIPTSSSSPKLPQQTLTKLPKSDLPSLSTAQLKSKLQSLQLPTGGTRNQMEQRLIEYTTLWNANCDSMRPKDVRVLRRELNRWENVVMRDMEVLKRSKDAGKDGKDAVVRQKGNELSEDGWKELIRSVKERKSKVVDDEETKVAGENKKKKSENVENEVKRDGTLVEGINVHDDWDDADDDQFFARE